MALLSAWAEWGTSESHRKALGREEQRELHASARKEIGKTARIGGPGSKSHRVSGTTGWCFEKTSINESLGRLKKIKDTNHEYQE